MMRDRKGRRPALERARWQLALIDTFCAGVLSREGVGCGPAGPATAEERRIATEIRKLAREGMRP